MKKIFYFNLLFLQFLILLITSCQTANKKFPFYPITDHKILPAPKGYDSDFEEILTEEQEKEIILMLENHERETTDQIAVVTLTTLEPYKNIDDYSLDLARYWSVGHKGKSNGILIAFGKGIRKIRIQNSYGIEKRLTDEETKRILDERMIPKFKENKYHEGLVDGISAIIGELNKNGLLLEFEKD